MRFNSLIFIVGVELALLTVQPVHGGGYQLTFNNARLTKDSAHEFHLELDAELVTTGFIFQGDAQIPFSSDEWQNKVTGSKQTTLTHAFLNDPADLNSPDAGAFDFWQFNVGLEIADFDHNGTSTIFDGVDGVKLSILGSHVKGPHDGDDVDPNTLPLQLRAFGREHDDDLGKLTLFSGRGSKKHIRTGGGDIHRDRYSARAEFVVIPFGFEGFPLDGDFPVKEVVIDAVHVGKGQGVSDGRTVGASESAAFYNDGHLDVSLGQIDIVSTFPTTAPTIAPQYATDTLVTGFPSFSFFDALYEGFFDGQHHFVPGSFGDLKLMAGDTELIASWDTMQIDSGTGKATALLTSVFASDFPDGNPSNFITDLLEEHMLYGDQSKLGLMFTFDASALLATTNGFTQNGDSTASPSPFILTGATVPEPATLILVALAGLILVLRRKVA